MKTPNDYIATKKHFPLNDDDIEVIYNALEAAITFNICVKSIINAYRVDDLDENISLLSSYRAGINALRDNAKSAKSDNEAKRGGLVALVAKLRSIL